MLHWLNRTNARIEILRLEVKSLETQGDRLRGENRNLKEGLEVVGQLAFALRDGQVKTKVNRDGNRTFYSARSGDVQDAKED